MPDQPDCCVAAAGRGSAVPAAATPAPPARTAAATRPTVSRRICFVVVIPVTLFATSTSDDPAGGTVRVQPAVPGPGVVSAARSDARRLLRRGGGRLAVGRRGQGPHPRDRGEHDEQ